MNRLRPAVIFIFITLFLDVLGIGLIMTQMVAEDEQGALQGSINSVVSLASIAGPPLWTSLFSWGVGMPQQLPGLPFLVAGVICFASGWVAASALRGRSLPAAPLPPR